MSVEREELVVLLRATLDEFGRQMQAAEKKGTSTYQKLQAGAFKATTAIEKQMLNSAKAQGRALDSIFGQTVERADKSAKSSAAFFREIERGRDRINQLKASLDPAYAAQLRYEEAVEEANRALRQNIITETEHRQILDQVSVAYLGAGKAAGAHTGAMGALGNMSNATRAKLQNAGFQVQDVAVQMMAGTSAARALSMQLPQLLGGFGLVGVAIGTLAAIGLPLLAMMFGEGEDAARGFDEAMGDVRNSISAMNEAVALHSAEGLVQLKEKYGEVNAELLEFIRLQTEATQIDAFRNVQESVAGLRADLEDWSSTLKLSLEDIFGGTLTQTNLLYAAFKRLETASTFNDQLAAATELRSRILEVTGDVANMTKEQYAFYKRVLDSEDALRQLAAAAPRANWLSGMISEAQTLAAALWEGVRAKAALGSVAGPVDDERGSQRRYVHDATAYTRDNPGSAGSAGGSAGGGGGSRRVDALIGDLQTEREVLQDWYAESLAILNGATDAELAVIGGRHEAMERLEAEHQERMKGIKDEAQTGALANAETFFGAMATLTANGGNRMAKISAVAAAIEGGINIARAQLQVLADPTLGFWQKLPAMAAIGAAGAKVLQSIRGAGGGGASSAGSAAGGGASGTSGGGGDTPLRALIEPLDPSALFSGAAVRKLLDNLTEEAGSRGLILGWRQ